MRVNYYFLVVWRCEETLLPPRANGSRLPRETKSWKTEIERFRRLLSLEYCARFSFGWKIAVGKKKRIFGPNIPQRFLYLADVSNGEEKEISRTTCLPRARSFGIFRNKNIFRNIFRLFCSWEQNSRSGNPGIPEWEYLRNKLNAYSHSNSYSGLIPNERASNFAGD